MLKLAGKQIKLAMENPALTVDSLTTPGLLIAMCVLFSENLPMACVGSSPPRHSMGHHFLVDFLDHSLSLSLPRLFPARLKKIGN